MMPPESFRVADGPLVEDGWKTIAVYPGRDLIRTVVYRNGAQRLCQYRVNRAARAIEFDCWDPPPPRVLV